MKARDLILQLTTLALQNPQVLDAEVDILAGGIVFNPVSVSADFNGDAPDDDEDAANAKPTNLLIETL